MRELLKRFASAVISTLKSQNGGAIVEFIGLALPLFIPIFIYLNQYALVSDTESSLRTLAREMSRALVTSENDNVAEAVAFEVFIKGGQALGFGDEIARGDMKYQIQCRSRPCISPNNEIEVIIISIPLDREISAVEYVSPWA